MFFAPRLLFSLLSLAIVAAAAYLLWSWYDGRLVVDAAGVAHLQRDGWRLGGGLALLAWSVLGKFAVTPLAARHDTQPADARHGEGQTTTGATGAPVYVEACGPAGAPTVILTHGWGMDSTFWNAAKRDLSDRFRLVVWDLPGLGKSRPASAESINLPAFAAELARLVETCGPAKPVRVGHSIGGMTIQTLLRDNPQMHRRLAGVVLLNTTYTNPLNTMIFGGFWRAIQKPVLEPLMKLTILLQPLVWLSNWQSYLSGSAQLAHRLGFGRFVTRSQLEHATLLATRNPPGAEARGNLAMFAWDATGALHGSPVPIVVVGGDIDIVTKVEASEVIAGETETASLQVVEGVNHLGPLERADVYNQLIADFVLQVQPSATMDTRPVHSPTAADIRLGREARDEPPPRLH